MSKIITLVTIAILGFIFLIFVISVLVLALKNLKKPKPEQSVISLILSGQKVSIERLNSFLSSSTPSKEELGILSGFFLENLKIPAKDEGKTPANAKAYFDFISLYAASQNSDAKMISGFNRDLKNKNPDYKKEIDDIEAKGLNLRKG